MSSRTAYEVQRDFALSCGLRSEIIWDSLAPDQADILKQKIETLLPGTDKNQKTIQQMRNELFNNVWQQRQYTNRNLLSSIIYVLISKETDANKASFSKEFTCHPVFRTRKCLRNGHSRGCCMIFVDEYARVYQDWNQFISHNDYEIGTMVAPAEGIYTFNYNDEVELEYHATPKSSKSSKFISATDNIFNLGSTVAAVPLMAAVAIPVSAPLFVAASTVAITGAAYSSLRSICRIRDRRKHCKSNAITNAEARNDWISMTSGILSLGAGGATKALSYAAQANGEVSLAAKLAVNGINVTSLVASGTGIASNVYELYTKQTVSSTDVLQLASSLLIFTHSINNIRIASKIQTKGSNSVLRAIKNQSRATFEKISNENLKLNRSSSGKLDIIRTLNDIPYKEVLMTLHKVNQHIVSGGSAIAAVKSAAIHLLPLFFSKLSGGGTTLNLVELAQRYGGKFVQHIVSASSFIDVVEAMVKYVCAEVFEFFMNLSRTFIEEHIDKIDRNLNTFISTENILYKIFIQTVTKYQNFTYQYLESKTAEIVSDIDRYFDSLNPVNYGNIKQKCPLCVGYVYRCNL